MSPRQKGPKSERAESFYSHCSDLYLPYMEIQKMIFFFLLFWYRNLNFIHCWESQIYWSDFLPSLLQTNINHLKHKSRGCVCWLLTSPADLTDLLMAALRFIFPFSACLAFIFLDSYHKKKKLQLKALRTRFLLTDIKHYRISQKCGCNQ